jgi:hypothetical protein
MSIQILRQRATISRMTQMMSHMLTASNQLRFISTESSILKKCPLGMLILKTKIFQGARRRVAATSRTTTQVRFAYLDQLKKSEIIHRLFTMGLASSLPLATVQSLLLSQDFRLDFQICNAISILQTCELDVSMSLAASRLAQR